MKKLWRDLLSMSAIFAAWRIMLLGVEAVAPIFWPLREGFLGFLTPWASFDGAHYTNIARWGYGGYQQAFFPLYPLLIRHTTLITKLPYEYAAILVSHVALFIGLFLFWRYLEGSRGRIWTIAFLLLYPASFFFTAAYSESLFFALASGVLLAIKRKRWIVASGLIGLASATRLIGIFFVFPLVFAMHKPWSGLALAPAGLLGYMAYLWKEVGDPLAFFHVQPAFGAGRSGSELVFLPQVFWRYARIFMTVPLGELVYHIAVLEVISLVFGIILLIVSWRKRYKPGILLYSACVLFLPTLTGTLSSMPRYTLALFPLFTVFGSMRMVWMRFAILIVFFALLVYASTGFLRGYFIS